MPNAGIDFRTQRRLSLASSQYSHEVGRLRVQGFEWDSVKSVIQDFNKLLESPSLQMLTQSILDGTSREEIDEPLWKDLSNYCMRYLFEIQEGDLEGMNEMTLASFWDTIIVPLIGWHDTLVSVKRSAMNTKSLTALSCKEEAQRLSGVIESLKQRLKGRRVCVTVKGHLAIVPLHTEIGDSMFILHGGQLPCVLREVKQAGISHNKRGY